MVRDEGGFVEGLFEKVGDMLRPVDDFISNLTSSTLIRGFILGGIAAVLILILLLAVSSCTSCAAEGGEGGDEVTTQEDESAEGTVALDALAQDQVRHGHVVRVVDGDTLIVAVDDSLGVDTLNDGAEWRVRLIGVDTPESVHPDASRNSEAGYAASGFTKAKCPEGTEVWLSGDKSDVDAYGRKLRHIWLKEPDKAHPDNDFVKANSLGALLLQAGMARVADFEPDTYYSPLYHSLVGE